MNISRLFKGSLLLTATSAALLQPTAYAQHDHGMDGMPGMQMDQHAPARKTPSHESPHATMDHGQPDHGNAATANTDAVRREWAPPVNETHHAHGAHEAHGAQMGPMQGGNPPTDARDPDAYADGLQPHDMPGMDMADEALYGRVLIKELELADGRSAHGQNVNAEAWYGNDRDKLWLKAEGERRSGRLDHLRTEVLWDRVFAPYWSTQLGIRHDTGQQKTQDWLAFGVQGLAPYWFETEATAYASTNGTLGLRTELSYELLLTQRLILEPTFEAHFYSRNDASRAIGAGLSDASFGLRLRYEIRRQFAPYIGVSWSGKFGHAADMARDQGERVRDTEILAGIRVWF